MMEPRPYQIEAIAAVSAAWQTQQPGEPSPLVCAATGTGKTELGLLLALPMLDAGRRVLWLAHRDDLVTDPIRRLVAARPDLAGRCGIVQADDDDGHADFVCASIATLAHKASVSKAGVPVPGGRLAACLGRGPFALVVTDEAHHCFRPATPIDTSGGVKPIAAVVPGDLVLSGTTHGDLCYRAVTRVWRREAPAMVLRIVTDFGTMEVTDGHRIYAPGGQRLAGELRPGDEVFGRRSGATQDGGGQLRGVFDADRVQRAVAAGAGTQGAGVLFGVVPKRGEATHEQRDNGGDEQSPRRRPDGAQERRTDPGATGGDDSGAAPGHHRGAGDPVRRAAMGQRAARTPERGAGRGVVGAARVSVAGHRPDGSAVRHPGPLETGRCESGAPDRGRGGRDIPSGGEATNGGRTQGGVAHVAGVDGGASEGAERAGAGWRTLGGVAVGRVRSVESMRADCDAVYDLEVEDTHRYFAAGVLVSNSAAKTWERLLDALAAACPGARMLGLTATPHRADGADLSARWDICYSYDCVRAISDGWLVPPFVRLAPLVGLDLSRVSSGRTDYDEGDLGRELLRAGVVAHTVARMTDAEAVTCRRMPEAMHEGVTAEIVPRLRRALVYTATVEQAALTAAALTDAGIPSRMVCGETSRQERRDALAAFVAGSVRCLCSAAVLTEGTNLPPADAVVLARPTRSWSLYVQMVGRGLRLADRKADCLVLDLAGATRVHSLIAPPVLVGGAACKEAPDGRHAYRPDAPPKGRCSHCGRAVACLAAAEDGHPGHVWAPDSTCKYCATPQCSGGPGPHVWLTRIHGDPPKPIRECARCPATTSDPLGGLLGDRVEYREARAWVWLPTVPRATGLLLADDLGALVMVPGSIAETWTPWFVPGAASRMRDPRRLAVAPVSTAEARERVAALVVKAPSRDEVNATAGRPREERRELVTLTGDARAVLGLHLTETPWPAAKPARTGAQMKRADFFRRKHGGRRW